MTADLHALLNTLRALEQQERSLKSALADALPTLQALKNERYAARNIVKGYEERPDHPHNRAALVECERLSALITTAEARIADMNRELQETRVAKDEITNGPNATATFVLAYQDAARQAESAQIACVEVVQRHAAAVTQRDAAAAALAAAEQARAQALDADAMARARALLTRAQADGSDAEALVANLERQLAERRAHLQKDRAALAAAHQQVWQARYNDECAALYADSSHQLHAAFAAGVASGAIGRGYERFTREVMAASPRPADLDDLLMPMAEALGVPAHLPPFAPV